MILWLSHNNWWKIGHKWPFFFYEWQIKEVTKHEKFIRQLQLLSTHKTAGSEPWLQGLTNWIFIWFSCFGWPSRSAELSTSVENILPWGWHFSLIFVYFIMTKINNNFRKLISLAKHTKMWPVKKYFSWKWTNLPENIKVRLENQLLWWISYR